MSLGNLDSHCGRFTLWHFVPAVASIRTSEYTRGEEFGPSHSPSRMPSFNVAMPTQSPLSFFNLNLFIFGWT
jgi:hypothetical protein